MNRVSSAMIPQSALADLSRAQRSLVEAGRQSSSQVRADDLAGYARDAQTLVSAQRLQARTQGFLDTTRELKIRMEVQDVALDRASGVMSSLRESLFQNVSLEKGDGVRTSIEEAFAVLRDTMNTSLNGRYLFGGVLNDRPPVKAGSIADLAASPLADVIEQGATPQQVRIEDSRTVQTGVVADTVVTTALASIKRIAELDAGPSGPFGGNLSSAQKAGLQAELDVLTQAFDQVLQAQSENGRLLNHVEAAEKRQGAQQLALDAAIGEIVDVDLAEVAVRLNQAQFGYEASASVFNTLRGLSLINYLR